ncbi:ABC transporter substrate-binding protein [Demequina flava]|uniref:ABC transporter substrate-binding protein n=1 Tax=Demequina flava TaxID=1095025 RepID=UPI000780814A|nr:ABC transporter substrate-binding protein [Demequina flava]
MARWNTIARGGAVLAAASLALAACSSGDSDADASASGGGSSEGGSTEALKIGTVLPLTGSLAFLGPPEVAGVDLAANEINDAGGVLGSPVEIIHGDSSDTQQANIAPQTASDLISDGVSAIVGAASSAVTLNFVDDVVAAEVVQVSPANTATALSGYDDFFFRTAPPDSVQGNALANLILDDGHTNVGLLVFNEDYGTGLRDVVKATVEEAGGTITYGNPGEEFDPAATNFTAEVEAVMATDPEAIVVIAFDQTKQIVPELLSAGMTSDMLYMTDGNTADYSGDFDPGAIQGAQGTIPGAQASDEFAMRLEEAYGEPLDSLAYGPESYDATMLIALAAVHAGATDGPSIQGSMAAVSGSTGGTECTGFEECAGLLEDGEEINYQAVSGVGPFNESNDPSAAFVGVYEFDENNTQSWVSEVFGEVPES